MVRCSRDNIKKYVNKSFFYFLYTICVILCSFVIGLISRLIIEQRVFDDEMSIEINLMIITFIGFLWIGLFYCIVISCFACFIGVLSGNGGGSNGRGGSGIEYTV